MSNHDPRETCPNRAQHTACPSGYTHWHEWAEKKSRTHRQVRCAGCGRLSIWLPKREGIVSAVADGEDR